VNDIATSTYHRVLRVAIVVGALVLVFDSGLIHDASAQLSTNTMQYMANAIGVSVGVEPTPLNQYTAALTQKERELADREAALRDREIAIGLNSGPAPERDYSTYFLSGILFILLVLILLNYALDYLRLREQQSVQPV
jgi:hypothetical protein